MLNITKNTNETGLTVALTGRLDTVTAPELEKELKALKEKPVDVAVEKVVDEDAIAAAKAETEEAHRKAVEKAEKALTEAKAQLADAAAAADKAKAAEQEANEKADALRKQLLTADPAVAEFKTLFEQWQKIYHDMDEKLKHIGGEDAEKAGKLRKAVRAAAAGMGA